jgi:hypothetical protein
MSAASHRIGKFGFIAALAGLIVVSAAPSPLSAQDQQQQQQQALTAQELGQLVAPIALYPDALLAQVLAASTYPLEVVMAARWSEKNPNLKGAALEDAMQKQPWEPSVKGLTSVPQVLAMMNDQLDWTQQLGEAFLAQPDDVQNAIQALRAKADAAGNLKSSNEQKVRRVAATPSEGYVGPPEYIVIEPTVPDYVYVPVYNPIVVYGAGYWEPAYVPFFWYPKWWTVGPVFGFGAPFLVGPALYYNYNWGYGGFGAIQVNTVYYSKFNKKQFVGDKAFKFAPEHHGKQAFKNKSLQEKFMGAKDKGKTVQSNKDFIANKDKIGNLEAAKNNKGNNAGAGGGKGSGGGGGGKGLQGNKGNQAKGLQDNQANKGLQGGKIQGAAEKNIQGALEGNKGKSSQANKGLQGGKIQGAPEKNIQGAPKGNKGNNEGLQANQGNKGQRGNKGPQANQGNMGGSMTMGR